MAEGQINNTTHSESPIQDLNPTTKITLYSLLLIVSLVGNVLVIVVVMVNKQSKFESTFNLIILNMAISDLVIPIVSLPILITGEASNNPWLIGGGTLGNILCKISYFLADASPAVSVFSLLIIAVERLIVTLNPIRRFVITQRLNFVCIGLTWLASMALMSPHLLTYKTSSMNGKIICSNFIGISSQNIYIVVVCAVVFVIPFIMLTVFYSIMLLKLNKNNERVHKRMRRSRQRKANNRTVFYISISICLSFTLLWGPYFCMVFAYYFFLDKRNYMAIFVVNYLAFANSAVNPFIYFIYLKSFRKGLVQIFRRGQFSHRNNSKKREERDILEL